MPGIDFRRAKQLIQIGEVMQLLGIPWTRASARAVRGPCPMGCSPSLTTCRYDGQTNLWYCHRCKLGGSPLDLWARARHMSLFAATIALFQLTGRQVPYLSLADANFCIPARKVRKDVDIVMEDDAE